MSISKHITTVFQLRRRQAVVLVVVIVCVAGILTASLWALFAHRAFGEDLVSIDPDTLYRVIHVVDGDTFIARIAGREVTVRVLGINTPETVDPRKPVECYGPEASAEAKSMLVDHRVKLIFNPNREKTDKYGRYLMYVYRDDGLFYNEHMLGAGFAREYTFGTPYAHQADFRAAQKAAKAAKKGLWGACPK